MNDFPIKFNCAVDTDEYMELISVDYVAQGSIMYFTNVKPDKHLSDTIEEVDEVCIGLDRKQVKKLRKFLKEWLDETRSVG